MIKKLIKWANGYRIVVMKIHNADADFIWRGFLFRFGENLGILICKDVDFYNLGIAENELKILSDHCGGSENIGKFLDELFHCEKEIKKCKLIAKKKLIKADVDIRTGEHWVLDTWNFPDSYENRAKILEKLPNICFLNDELLEWEDLKKPSRAVFS